MSAWRRVLTIAVITGALVGAAIVDRDPGRAVIEAEGQPAAAQMPIGARAGAQSSSFACAGGTATDGGAANGVVSVANAGSVALRGTIVAVGLGSTRAERALNVPPATRVDIAITDLVTSPFASALVLLDGGEAVVEMTGSGPLGTTITPCASDASDSWYFAEGVTTRDAREVLSLFNPFADDALVDLRFLTEEGEVTPESLTGLSVPGQGLVALDLGEHVQRREEVATILTARAGRLVVARLQTFDGTQGRRGVSLALGAPSPGATWYFPEGLAGGGINERIQLFNPSSTQARVEIDLVLAGTEAEAIVMTVPPESRVTVSANEETRIPQGQPHSIVVRETSGVGIVAERTLEGAEPSSRRGVAHALGSRLTATRWVVAAGRADADFDGWLVLLNPSAEPAQARVELLDGNSPARISALANLQIAAGARVAVRLGDSVRPGLTPVLVTATAPIVVERDQYRTGGPGMGMAMAVPLRDP